MKISKSLYIIIEYLMKDYNWSLKEENPKLYKSI